MRHKRRTQTLGRRRKHRLAMLRNLAFSLIEHERIKTTHIRAKELVKFMSRLITIAKKKDLNAKRRVMAILGVKGSTRKKNVKWTERRKSRHKELVDRLFNVIAERFNVRQETDPGGKGGYLRVLKLYNRRGDGALISLVEFV